MQNNRLEFLLLEYGNFFMGVLRTEGLLKALRLLPGGMVLKKNDIEFINPSLPPTIKDKTVLMRIEEIEVEYTLLKARLQAAEEMIKAEEGGKEALEEWSLDKSQYPQ